MKKKLRKERPRVKLVLRCKIVMSPGFSNPKWSNWCTFYPFLTPNMTRKGQKWPQPRDSDSGSKFVGTRYWNWSTYLFQNATFLKKCDVFAKKSVRFGFFIELWQFGGQSVTFKACRVDPWLEQTTNQLLIWSILFPIWPHSKKAIHFWPIKSHLKWFVICCTVKKFKQPTHNLICILDCRNRK